MKTLDEVIKALEICWEQGTCSKECPYMMEEPSCGLRRELDALHYLRQLQLFRQTPLMQGIHKAEKEYALYHVDDWGEDNPPLTWDELQQMEGKPVWVEYDDHFPGRKGTKFKEWEVIDVIFDDRLVAKGEWDYHKNEMGQTWQAYRKERE